MKKKSQNILLLKKFKSLGEPGDIVTVSVGFSRNYLLPFKFGKIATREALNEFNLQQTKILLKEETLLQKQLSIKSLIEEIKPLMLKKEIVGNTNQLFGKVTKNDILNILQEHLNSADLLDKQQIELPEIQNLGKYQINIRLGKNIIAKLSLNVIPNESRTKM